MKSKTVWESADYKLRVEFIDENGGGPDGYKSRTRRRARHRVDV
jgi:hypothetical protein